MNHSNLLQMKETFENINKMKLIGVQPLAKKTEEHERRLIEFREMYIKGKDVRDDASIKEQEFDWSISASHASEDQKPLVEPGFQILSATEAKMDPRGELENQCEINHLSFLMEEFDKTLKAYGSFKKEEILLSHIEIKSEPRENRNNNELEAIDEEENLSLSHDEIQSESREKTKNLKLEEIDEQEKPNKKKEIIKTQNLRKRKYVEHDPDYSKSELKGMKKLKSGKKVPITESKLIKDQYQKMINYEKLHHTEIKEEGEIFFGASNRYPQRVRIPKLNTLAGERISYKVTKNPLTGISLPSLQGVSTNEDFNFRKIRKFLTN